VNACVRKESRTKRLAEKLLFKLGEPYEELCLEKIAFPLVNEEYLNKRDQLISSGSF
jgi:FMN-dependent NADH-azoreductase